MNLTADRVPASNTTRSVAGRDKTDKDEIYESVNHGWTRITANFF